MYKLYVIKNKDGKRYIGISSDVEKRLNSHNRGSVRSTKPYKPWHLVYCEEYQSRLEARQREVFLKSNFTARSKIFDKF